MLEFVLAVILATSPSTHAAVRVLRVSLPAVIAGAHSVAINTADDIAGSPDPAAWGTSGAIASRIHFDAPSGYRVRILRVSGDFIAVPKSGAIPPDSYAEVGWGLKTTAPDGSALVDFPGYAVTPYDNSFLWRQNLVLPGNPSPRLSFDQDVSAGGLLGPDSVLLSQAFVALNTTGLTIHMEPTFVVVFEFEAI